MSVVEEPSIWDPEVDFGTPEIRGAVESVSVTIDARRIETL